MGHLPIVNQETIKNVIKSGYIATRGDLRQHIIKTTSDIFSDVLAVRKGDLIFPWIVHGESGENMGFKYVFKISGPPIFVKGDDYPVKVQLWEEGLVFENPLSEADALDLWDKKILWNAIGKKSLGRGRSLTHQTPMEDQKMLELLEERNPKGPKKIILQKGKINGVPLSINPSQRKWNNNLLKTIKNLPEKDRLKSLDLDGVPWAKEKFFAVEKTLEAWLMENIDKDSCLSLRNLLFDGSDKIIWFGNYLPFGVQGSNMDVVILHERKNNKLVITVIELKVGTINKNQFLDTCGQVIDYSNFLKKAFDSFGISVELNPVILTGISKISSFQHIRRNNLNPKFIGYEVDSKGKVIFRRLL